MKLFLIVHPRDLPSLFASIFSCLSLSPTLDVALSLFGSPHPASTFYTWFTVGGGGGVALRKSAVHVRVHVHVEALKVAVANAIKTNAKNMRKAQKKNTTEKQQLRLLLFKIYVLMSSQFVLAAANASGNALQTLMKCPGDSSVGASILLIAGVLILSSKLAYLSESTSSEWFSFSFSFFIQSTFFAVGGSEGLNKLG